MRIAIIGGGFSGACLGYYLSQMDHHITLFEKEDRIGGQCFSLKYQEEIIELGSVFALTERIEALAKECGAKLSTNYYYRAFKNSAGKNISQIKGDQAKKILDQYHKLPEILKEYEEGLNTPGFTSCHPDLFEDFLSWSKKHHMEELMDLFSPYICGFGYGNHHEISTLYALKHLDLETLKRLTESQKVMTFKEGASDFVEKLIKPIKEIRYSSPVLRVSKNRVTTKYGTDEFDRVILTCVLPGEIMENEIHQEIMKSYIFTEFMVASFGVDDAFRQTVYIQDHFHQQGKPVLIHSNHPFSQGKLVSVYGYGPVLEEKFVEEAKTQLKTLGYESSHPIAVKSWKMFPHVSKENLELGFYQGIEKIQGNDGIYFAGALVSFQNLDKIASYANYFAHHYFGKVSSLTSEK